MSGAGRWTRTLAVALVSVVACWTALVALGPHGAAGQSAAARESIVLWHSYGEAEERGLDAAVRAFEAAHPDVDVTVSAIPWGAYASKLESAIPVRRGPDVFIDAHNRIEAYRAAHLLRSFDERPHTSGWSESQFDPAHLDALRHGPALYGTPISVKAAALFVATALVRSDSVDSLADLERLRATLPAETFPLAWDGDDAFQFAALVHAYGGRLIDDEGHYTFDGPPAERALERFVELTEHHVVPTEPSYELVRDLFRGGRAATAISGPWLAYDLPSSLAFEVAPLPRVEGGERMHSFATIEAAMVSAHTEHAEAAEDLCYFLSGPEGSRIRALEGGHVIANRVTAQDPALAERPLVRAFLAAAADAIVTPTHRNVQSLFGPAERAIRKVLRGDMPARDALAEGRHRFEDDTRPPPEARDPRMAMVGVGAFLVILTVLAVRRASRPEVRDALARSVPAYAWIAHAVIAVGLLVILPLVVGAATSFFAGEGRDLHYVGLANYVSILTARGGDLLGRGSFFSVLGVTVLWTVANISLHVILGVALALALHRPTLRWKGLYRVLLVIPWAVPSYVTALAWRGMFHRQFGAVNALLDVLGIEPVSWFAQFSTAFTANVATNVWLGFPFMMVVTLGALTAIPRDLYEAAELDGATPAQQFRHITMPLLVPSLAPAVAMGAVWTFNMFNVVYLVSAGEPDGATEILVSEAYRWAFTRGHQYGYAAAYAVLIFGILALSVRGVAAVGDAAQKRSAGAAQGGR